VRGQPLAKYIATTSVVLTLTDKALLAIRLYPR
jgi:hypothetical protein